MIRPFRSIITVIVAFAMVFTFIPFLGSSQAYATSEYDLGTFVMDVSEGSIDFSNYVDAGENEYGSTYEYSEEEAIRMAAIRNTLKKITGVMLMPEAGYSIDLDKDGTYDIGAGYWYIPEGFEDELADLFFLGESGSSLLRPKVIKLSAASKQAFDNNEQYYYSTIKFIVYPASQTFSINNAKVQSVAARTYSGSAWKPLPTVTVNGYKLKADDYTVTYSNNVSVGTAKITFKGKGVLTGSVSKTFKINPKGTTLTTPTKGRTYITVKWNKQATKMKNYPIKGYQIYFATNSSFTKGLKKYLVSPYTVTSKKITGLTPGKTYYFKVRTYKVVNKVYYYSTWSAYKKVTTNK